MDRLLLEDLVTTFDDQIVPVAARSVGLAHDIDGDGRFTVLISSWLGRLGNGRHAVDGFVRVTDLDPLYSPPFGNRCDMMYLSTGLKPGPHLRTIMAHEYMHAVVFSQKSLPLPEALSEHRSRKKAGSTRPWPTWPRTCTASRGRTSTIASPRSCHSPSVINWLWKITTRPTCSAATAIGDRPTCSCGGASTSSGRS